MDWLHITAFKCLELVNEFNRALENRALESQKDGKVTEIFFVHQNHSNS
jgi:hypothetical protein